MLFRSMSKEIPQSILDYYQSIMDDDCTACYNSPDEGDAGLIREDMFVQLEPLRGRAVEAGLDPTGVFQNFRRTCDDCFGRGRPAPTLSMSKSCAIGIGLLGQSEDSST